MRDASRLGSRLYLCDLRGGCSQESFSFGKHLCSRSIASTGSQWGCRSSGRLAFCSLHGSSRNQPTNRASALSPSWPSSSQSFFRPVTCLLPDLAHGGDTGTFARLNVAFREHLLLAIFAGFNQHEFDHLAFRAFSLSVDDASSIDKSIMARYRRWFGH